MEHERALTVWEDAVGRLYAECHDTGGWYCLHDGEWFMTLMPFEALWPVSGGTQVLAVFDGVAA